MVKTLVFILLLILSSCRSGGADSQRNEGSDAGQVSTLPLPSPPASLTAPEERAAFVVRHFWDSLDFRSDPLALDTAFLEQNFSNFISVLAVAPADTAREAVDSLLKMALASPKAFALLSWVVDKYLDDPDSPMRDEELYILFLENLIGSAQADEATRARAKFRLDRAMKNRRGSRAADFRFTDRDGNATTLYKSLGATATLLMFYDPDCPQCSEAKDALASLSPAEGVRVEAIDIAGDRRLWDSTKASMPETWTVGFATDPIAEKETYIFPALPTFYLLDPAGIVILKDPPLETLISAGQNKWK